MNKPRVFIGSSTQQLDVAYYLQSVLQSTSKDAIEATVWTDGVFGPTKSTLGALYKALHKYHFAVFLFSPTDVAVISQRKQKVARDNVVFETGLFMGGLGKRNVVIVRPKDVPLHLPSDLLGVTYVDYDQARFQSDPEAALRPCCLKIVKHIIKIYYRDRAESKKRDINTILEVAARLVADRSGVSVDEIRAFCHLFNEEKKCLQVLACFTGSRTHHDQELEVPCSGKKAKKAEEDWYVISRSYRQNDFICENIDRGAIKKFVKSGAVNVWPDLKAVAAYPIHRFGDIHQKIGVVSVDGSKEIESLKWDRYEGLQCILDKIGNYIYDKIEK